MPAPGPRPAVCLDNLAADPSGEEVADEEIAKMDRVQRMTIQMARQGCEAKARYLDDLDDGRIELTFDDARGGQPGHYLGLAADANGVFHPLWIRRRNGLDELFSTAIDVAAPAAPPASGGEPADITAHVLVAYDPADGREWSFEGRLGSRDRLPPRGASKPVKIELQVRSGVGTPLDFRIFGRIAA